MPRDHRERRRVGDDYAGEGRSGFTLVELLVVIAIIALLIAILLPVLASARKSARTAVCQSNMNQLSTAQAAYGVDFDWIAALNWRPGEGFDPDPRLRSLERDNWTINQGKQACGIVRRKTGRPIPLVNNRSFNRNFWHLVLVDGGYFGNENRAIVTAAACPEDGWAQLWQKNEDNYDVLVGSVGPDRRAYPNGAYEHYRPYWSTYQLSPVAWTPDRDQVQDGSRHVLTQELRDHHLYRIPPTALTTPMGRRRFDEVAFPSQKVFFHDLFDRHSYKRPIWFAYDVAKQPLAFFDGSVRVYRTGDAYLGWDPDQPESDTHITYAYHPTDHTGFPGYDYATLSGEESDEVQGYYRWTRGGLGGADY